MSKFLEKARAAVAVPDPKIVAGRKTLEALNRADMMILTELETQLTMVQYATMAKLCKELKYNEFH